MYSYRLPDAVKEENAINYCVPPSDNEIDELFNEVKSHNITMNTTE